MQLPTPLIFHFDTENFAIVPIIFGTENFVIVTIISLSKFLVPNSVKISSAKLCQNFSCQKAQSLQIGPYGRVQARGLG